MSAKYRVFSPEFKDAVVQRILNGESVTALHRELQIKRTLLYRWRDAYLKEGTGGLRRSTGRPTGMPGKSRPTASAETAAAQRIAELERKIGQQTVDLDFLRRAFKRVKESRRSNTGTGATASTRRFEA